MSSVESGTSVLLDPKVAKQATRVMDMLDRWDDRLQDHYGRQRKHNRSSLRTVITLRMMMDGPDGPEPVMKAAWTRNISQGGMSFILPDQIPVTRLLAGLKMSGDGPESWFHIEICRSREVQDGFWEYGAVFRGKAV